MKKVLFTIAFAALLVISAEAQDWDEIGSGSGTLPGIFKAENFDGSVSAAGRFEHRASLAGIAGGYPMIVFRSESSNNRNYVWSLAYDNRAWAAPDGTSTGQVFGGIGYDPGELRLSGNDLGLSTAFVSTLPQFLQQDAYAGVWSSLSGWVDLGGSLEDGGITGITSFTDLVYNIGTTMGPDGFPDVAYSLGPKKGRSIYVRSFDGSSWSGLDDSDTVPIALGNTTTPLSFEHPSMAFRLARPVVAYTQYERELFETIRVQIFNPTANEWQELGTSASVGLGDGRRPQVATVDGMTNIFVAWENRLNGDLKVFEWNGGSWADLGDPLEPWGLTRIDTFDDRRVTDPEPSVANFALAMDLGNRPVVAFRAESPPNSGKFHIFASYRDRQDGWVAMGSPENDFAGLSMLPYTLPDALGHYNPTIYIPADNRPVIAWTFDGTSTEEGPIVLARQWSESIPGFTPQLDQVVDLLTGRVDGNPILNDALDANDDGIVDSGDAAELRF